MADSGALGVVIRRIVLSGWNIERRVSAWRFYLVAINGGYPVWCAAFAFVSWRGYCALVATRAYAKQTLGANSRSRRSTRCPTLPQRTQMRDWRQTATNFDTLAFNTTAAGQYLPLVHIDNTFQPPQTQTWYGLPSYVGETRTFGETGEPIHEAVASLAAVWGGTLVGVDKSAGPYDYVAMSKEYYVDRNSQYIVLNTPFSSSGQSAWYETYPDILMYAIADRYPNETSIQTALNTVDQRFYSAVNVLTAGGTAPNFNHTAFNFATQKPVDNGQWKEPDMGLGMAWLQYAAYWRNRTANPTLAASYLNAVDWSLSPISKQLRNPDYEVLTPFGAYTAARMNAEQGRNYDVQKIVNWVFSRSTRATPKS